MFDVVVSGGEFVPSVGVVSGVDDEVGVVGAAVGAVDVVAIDVGGVVTLLGCVVVGVDGIVKLDVVEFDDCGASFGVAVTAGVIAEKLGSMVGRLVIAVIKHTPYVLGTLFIVA